MKMSDTMSAKTMDERFNKILQDADNGDVDAQVIAAMQYDQGTPKNPEMACKYLQLAAAQKHRSAQNVMGHYNEHGIAMDKNPQEAFRFYSMASAQNHSLAMCNLGRCHYYGIGTDVNYDEAFRLYSACRELDGLGESDVMDGLGMCYAEGKGVRKNLKEAVNCFKEGAEWGHAWAQYHLGVCYKKGIGVRESTTKAMEWFLKAAEQGLAQAKYQL